MIKIEYLRWKEVFLFQLINRNLNLIYLNKPQQSFVLFETIGNKQDALKIITIDHDKR